MAIEGLGQVLSISSQSFFLQPVILGQAPEPEKTKHYRWKVIPGCRLRALNNVWGSLGEQWKGGTPSVQQVMEQGTKHVGRQRHWAGSAEVGVRHHSCSFPPCA